MNIVTILLVLGVSTITAKDTSKPKVNHELMKQSLFYGLVATAAEEPLTSTCRMQLAKTADGIMERSRWAIKMLDASGVPTGQLHFGGTYWLGSRALCEAIEVPKNLAVSKKYATLYKETAQDVPPFPLAYYAAYFQHHSNIQIMTNIENEHRVTWSMCLPKSCKGTELSDLLQNYFDLNLLPHQFIYNTTYKMEEVKQLYDDFLWLSDTKIFVVGSITALLIALCIAGTLFDVYYYQPILKIKKKTLNLNNNIGEGTNGYKKTEMNGREKECLKNENENGNQSTKIEHLNINLGLKIIRCFSLYSNNKAIFQKKIDSKSLPSIHGLRLLSMIYAIIGHSVLFMQEFFDNRAKIFFLSDEVYLQIFFQATFSVDTFFCISGFILAYGFFNSSKPHNFSGRIKLFASGVIKRFLRLTPSYIYTLFLAEIMANWRFRVTPFWSNERNDLICPDYWWRNILYINNLYPRNEMCLAWSWYMSNDMQFFIIMNFLLVFSTVNFKAAVSLLATLFFGSIAYTASLVYSKNFLPSLDEVYNNREDFYDNPLVRIGPFIVGIVAGYILHYFKKTLPLKKPVIWVLWIIGPAINLYILFGTADRNFSLPHSIAYVSLSRIFWSIGIAWILIACETGNAGIIHKILSYRFWLPYSRLSFIAYLINPIVIFLVASFTDTPFEAEISNLLVVSTGYVLLTYFVSYIITLLVESPNIGLTTMLFDYLKKKEAKDEIKKDANMNIEKLVPSDKEKLKMLEKQNSEN